MGEIIKKSGAAKWKQSPNVTYNGTLYLTDKRLIFALEKNAPIVRDHVEVKWEQRDWPWEIPLSKIKKPHVKKTLTGPTLTIIDRYDISWTFVISKAESWAIAINSLLKFRA